MKKMLSCMLCLLAITGFAANLIQNSEVDSALVPEFRLEGKSGCYKFAPFIEEGTWNKCAKLEIIQYYPDNAGKKRVSANVYIGGEKGITGFVAKPNTTYKFSVELKGTVKRAFINAREWTGSDYYKDKKDIKSTLGTVQIQPEWTCYKGSFKTGPDAKRAALDVAIWGSEAQRSLQENPGEYLMIDKIKIEEQLNVLDSAMSGAAINQENKSVSKRIIEAASASDATDASAWDKTSAVSGFVELAASGPVKADAEIKAIAGKNDIFLRIKCNEPAMDKLCASVTENGLKVWKDDVVEIFFDPVSSDRKLSQFVVAAGGGRYMGHGGGSAVDRYGEWDAKIIKSSDSWIVEARIPYKLLGWTERPADGTMIGFNICRQRTPVKELSSWSWCAGNFHNRQNFGALFIGGASAWLNAAIGDISSGLNDVKDSDVKKSMETELAALKKTNVAGMSSDAMEKAYTQIEKMRKELKFLKMGGRKFVLSAISPTTDTSIPLLPEEIARPQEKISIRAAVNEFKPLTLTLTNLTGLTDEYRVVIYSKLKDLIEQPGLSGENGKDFPSSKLTMYRGVRVKDSDNVKHGQRFDPLAPMDSSYTVAVPPKESGLIWATFDCRGVKPGKYTGFIRIIPLNEPAKFVNEKAERYQGPMQDIPLELEVLPIELSEKPTIPLMLFRGAINEQFFKVMVEHDIRNFQISPWSFNFSFNDDGSMITAEQSKVENEIKQYREWARKYGIENEIKYTIAFSAYTTFMNAHAKNKFKYGTPEWRRAWQEWIKGVAATMRKCGIPEIDYSIELWDEPHRTDDAAVIETCRLAHEAVPEMWLQITLGASMQPVDVLEKIAPYVNEWCFWGDYLVRPEYLKFFKQLQVDKKRTWFYYCDTSLRADLYRYYRRHSWLGSNYGVDTIALWCLAYGPGGYYGVAAWKAGIGGSIAYRSFDDCLTSVRFECLRIGSTDLKYMKKLADVAAAAKAAGTAPELVQEAEKLLKDAPNKVSMTDLHDSTAAETIRNKAIDLILKIQAKTGN